MTNLRLLFLRVVQSVAILSVLVVASPRLAVAQQFQTAHSYKVGGANSYLARAATGDFNNDGFQDVAVTWNPLSGNGSVSVLLANAHGVLSAPVNYSIQGSAIGIAVGDFNHDGKLDLATVGSLGVNILLGKGDGTFQPAVKYASTYYLTMLAVGDFNGDGNTDLLVAAAGEIYFMAGNGDGTFHTGVMIASSGYSYVSMGAADFNGDGKLDFAVAQTGASPGFVSVFLGNGNGTFQTPVSYNVGDDPQGLAIADFNGDGKPDVAVSECSIQKNQPNCEISGSISTLLGNGDGTFQAAKTMPNSTDIAPGNLAAADFNGDGKMDLAVDCSSGSDVSVFLGNGNGTYAQAQNWASGSSSSFVAVGDFNGDGVPDLVMLDPTGQTISVLLSAKGGKFGAARDYEDRAQPLFVVAGDFNGDGVMDLAAGEDNTFAVSVMLGRKGGGFASPVTNTISATTGVFTQDVVTADLNGDHNLDLVAVGTGAGVNGIAVLLGNGDGTFKPGVIYAAGNFPYAVVIGDFNGDGIPDLAVANLGWNVYGSVELLIGNGDGTFKPAVSISVGNNYPYWITAGDFNGDGKLDLAVTDGGEPGTIGILLGNGDGTFQPLLTGPAVGTQPLMIAAADLNGDGKLDIVVCDQYVTKDNVQVALGNGDGTFKTATAYTAGQYDQGFAIADFNGDGIPDIALANSGDDTSGSVVLLLGKGDGTFKSGPTFAAGSAPYGIVSADFNGDGKPDLAVANVQGDNITLLLNITP